MEFEKYMVDLEEIVKKLDNGSITLDESLKLFNEGVTLSEKCMKILKGAEGKITELTDKLGVIEEKEFVYESDEKSE